MHLQQQTRQMVKRQQSAVALPIAKATENIRVKCWEMKHLRIWKISQSYLRKEGFPALLRCRMPLRLVPEYCLVCSVGGRKPWPSCLCCCSSRCRPSPEGDLASSGCPQLSQHYPNLKLWKEDICYMFRMSITSDSREKWFLNRGDKRINVNDLEIISKTLEDKSKYFKE